MRTGGASPRAFAALVALVDHRLSSAAAGRVGAVGVGLVVLVAVAEILATPPGRDGAAVAVGAAGVLAWVGAGPPLLAAAGGQPRRDEADGIVSLVALQGHAAASWAVARVVGFSWLVLRRVGLVAMLLCVLGAVHANSFGALPRRLAGLAGFALSAGLVLGALAEACSRVGAKRSSALLVAIVVIPWALAPSWGHPRWSVPGSLAWALDGWTGTAASWLAPLATWGLQ